MVIKMQNTTQSTTFIICPNETKMKLLKDASSKNELLNIKFMTKEEYKNIYYFSYNEKTLAYLMKKYNYNIDVCKVYLNNLYVIDEAKTYISNKSADFSKILVNILKN